MLSRIFCQPVAEVFMIDWNPLIMHGWRVGKSAAWNKFGGIR